MNNDLQILFDAEGLMRYTVIGDEHGEPAEIRCGPLVALGPRDDDFVQAPNPDTQNYPGKPASAMNLEDYNHFMYRWLEQAVSAGDVRCAHCGKQIIDGDDLPDADTWDAIFIEKELVAWMVVHFDCKRWLAKKLKGMHPFDLTPATPPRYDLSHVSVPEAAPHMADTDTLDIPVDTPSTK